MPTDTRPRVEIARAVLRLHNERVVPVEQLREQARAGVHAIIRWITQGKRGVHLDAYHKPGVGWVSSGAAVDRFHAQYLVASMRAVSEVKAGTEKGGAA